MAPVVGLNMFREVFLSHNLSLPASAPFYSHQNQLKVVNYRFYIDIIWYMYVHNLIEELWYITYSYS